MAHSTVLVTRREPACVELSLDAPERRNALSPALVSTLADALHDAVAGGARVVALRSTGPAFCAGFDLAGPLDGDADARRRFTQIQALLDALRTLPAVTVACVDGPAIGAGADLAVACDVRLATGRARFRFPGSRFGIVLGLQRLVAVVGPDLARDLALRARVLGADEAAAAGLVELVDGPTLDAYPLDLARDVEDLDPQTLATILAVTRRTALASDAVLLRASAARPGLAARIRAFGGRR